MRKIIEETNKLRALHPNIPRQYDAPFLRKLKISLENTSVLRRHSGAINFIKDLDDSLFNQHISLHHTKKYINQQRDYFILSAFNAPYFPNIKIESCLYRPLGISPVLKEKYKTNVLPVNIIACSKGFLSKTVVALFPENHIDNIQLSHDKIFYFIDKFVERFFRITHKMLNTIVADNSFSQITHASYKDIEQAALSWVWLHEYYHRQGPLPIPEYLDVKSLKPLAGLEEMRVDVCSIITCIEDQDIPRDLANFMSQFILAERLLRYPIEGIPKPNYDAIASQLLFNFLQENDGLVVQNMKIKLTKKYPLALKKLLNHIHGIESGIVHQSKEEVQLSLLNFTKAYTNFNTDEQDFHHIHYFKEIKELLQL